MLLILWRLHPAHFRANGPSGDASRFDFVAHQSLLIIDPGPDGCGRQAVRESGCDLLMLCSESINPCSRFASHPLFAHGRHYSPRPDNLLALSGPSETFIPFGGTPS